MVTFWLLFTSKSGHTDYITYNEASIELLKLFILLFLLFLFCTGLLLTGTLSRRWLRRRRTWTRQMCLTSWVSPLRAHQDQARCIEISRQTGSSITILAVITFRHDCHPDSQSLIPRRTWATVRDRRLSSSTTAAARTTRPKTCRQSQSRRRVIRHRHRRRHHRPRR